MSLKVNRKTMFELMSEFESIRFDPDAYVNEHIEKILYKINFQRDFIIQEIAKKINEHFTEMQDQLNKAQALCVDKIKFGMENCFISKLEDLANSKNANETKIQELLFQIKKIIQDVFNSEINLVDKTVQIENKFIKVEYKLKLNELVKYPVQKLPDLNRVSIKQIFSKHFNDIHKIFKVPNRNEVVSASMDNSIKLWDLEAGLCKWMICVNKPIFQVFENEIICAQNESSLKFYDLETGELKKSFIDIDFEISCILALNSDIILTGLSNGEILVWSKKISKITDVFPGHTMNVSCLNYLNTSEILSGSWDNSIKLWDFNDREFIRSFEGHSSWVTCLEIFNENEFLSGSKDGTIKIWHKQMNMCIETLYGHIAGINSIKAFENYQLFSCSDDRTLKHWDTVKGVCLKSIEISKNSFVFDFIVLDNGSLITSESKKIKIWK